MDKILDTIECGKYQLVHKKVKLSNEKFEEYWEVYIDGKQQNLMFNSLDAAMIGAVIMKKEDSFSTVQAYIQTIFKILDIEW